MTDDPIAFLQASVIPLLFGLLSAAVCWIRIRQRQDYDLLTMRLEACRDEQRQLWDCITKQSKETNP